MHLIKNSQLYVYLLKGIVFIPLFFLPISLPFFSAWYEKPKVFLFLLLFFMLIFVQIRVLKRADWYFVFFTLLVVGISTLLSPHADVAFWGSPEKRHGWIFYSGLTLAYFLLKRLNTSFVPSCVSWTLIPLTLYAAIQLAWIDIQPASAFAEGIFATLWNSNYLGGYALLTTPFIFMTKRSLRKTLFFLILILFLIIASKTLGALLLFVGYLFLLFRKNIRQHFGIAIMCFFLFGALFSFYLYESQKYLDLFARFILWKDVFMLPLESLSRFFFWYGADTLGFLEGWRSTRLNQYIPSEVTIDRAHNTFIDVFFWFGIVGFFTLAALIISVAKDKKSYPLHIIILFACFFFFHIPTVSHWLLLIYGLSKKPE